MEQIVLHFMQPIITHTSCYQWPKKKKNLNIPYFLHSFIYCQGQIANNFMHIQMISITTIHYRVNLLNGSYSVFLTVRVISQTKGRSVPLKTWFITIKKLTARKNSHANGLVRFGPRYCVCWSGRVCVHTADASLTWSAVRGQRWESTHALQPKWSMAGDHSTETC